MEGSILCFSLLPLPPSPPFCTCHQELGIAYGFLVPSLPGGRGGRGGTLDFNDRDDRMGAKIETQKNP